MTPHSYLLTTAQRQQARQRAFASGNSATDLLEADGRAAAHELRRRWSARKVTVLCGPSVTGARGFTCARHLADPGFTVRIAVPGAPESASDPAGGLSKFWSIPVETLNSTVIDGADLFVDALAGAGSLPSLLPEIRAALARRPLIALDIPCGVDPDNGAVTFDMKADLTIAFGSKSPGHLLLPGRLHCGEVVVVEGGLSDALAMMAFLKSL